MPENLQTRRRRAHLALAATLSGLAAGAAVLLAFPPQNSSFYPLCPFHQWTGLLCPGCGATRALAALLHGRVAEASGMNALVVAALPVIAVYLMLAYTRAVTAGRPTHSVWPRIPVQVTSAALICATVFTLARNLR